MVQTISRDELKQKIDRGDNFLLVETLAKTAYEHVHLPHAINLPPDQIRSWLPPFCPTRIQKLSCTVPALLDTLRMRPPVNWRRWVTQTCVTTLKENRTGSTPVCLSLVTTIINAAERGEL
jgi:hypothetical protein